MATISYINVNAINHSVRDSQVPEFTNSESTYLCGDGSWSVPTFIASKSGITFVDGGNYLLVLKTS